jgi:hypothetical protein
MGSKLRLPPPTASSTNFKPIPNKISMSTEGILVFLDTSPKKKDRIMMTEASMIRL